MERREQYQIHTPEDDKELPKNVVIVETTEARMRIIYGKHDTVQPSADLGQADLVVLETGSYDYSNRASAIRLMNMVESDIQYPEVLEKAEAERKPVYFIDIASADFIPILSNFLAVAEAGAAIFLLANLAQKDLPREQVSRRDFFKKTGKGVGAAWLFSQSAEMVNRIIMDRKTDETSAKRIIQRVVTDLNEMAHPETHALLLTLRNYLWAQKLKTIAADTLVVDRKPEIAMVVGALHHGLESALQKDDEQRTRLIDTLLSVPGLEEARRKVANIARLDFDASSKQWEARIFKDPVLAGLEHKS